MDTVFNATKNIDPYILFHFLTNYQFYDYDETNEFYKNKQINHFDQETKDLKKNWKSKYKLAYSSRICIWINPEDAAWLTLGEYDFSKNAFPIAIRSFGPFTILANHSINSLSYSKILSFLKDKVPTTSRCLDYAFLSLKLDTTQQKTIFLHFNNTDSAEIFRNSVKDRKVSCEVLVEPIADDVPSIIIEETDSFKEFRQNSLDEFHNSKKTHHVYYYGKYSKDGTIVHPFANLTKQQIEKEIIRQYISIHEGRETHLALYSLNIPCKIFAMRFFLDEQKIIEWRIK